MQTPSKAPASFAVADARRQELYEDYQRCKQASWDAFNKWMAAIPAADAAWEAEVGSWDSNEVLAGTRFEVTMIAHQENGAVLVEAPLAEQIDAQYGKPLSYSYNPNELLIF